MGRILEQLLSHSNDDGIVIESVDSSIEESAMESTLPMDVLIESVATDIDNSIIQAMETYQMGCIIGGARVVSESAGAERAQELLEGAVGDFFTKIKETLKKIWDWFVSIGKKLSMKFAPSGKDIQEKYKAKLSDFNKNFESGKFKFNGVILDYDKSKSVVDKLQKYVDESMAKVKSGSDIRAAITKDDDNFDKTCEDIKSDKAIEAAIGAKSSGEVSKYINKLYGADKDSEEHTVTDSDWKKMEAVIIEASADSTKKTKEASKKISTAYKDIVKIVNSIEHEFRGGDNAAKAKSYCSAMTSAFNKMAGVTQSCLSTHLSVIHRFGKAYVSFMSKVASGSGTKATEESIDLSYMFESEMLESEDIDIEDEGDDCGSSVKESYLGEGTDLIDAALNFVM